MLSSTNTRNDYVGNGLVDTYSYTFHVFDQTHLLVKVRDPDTDVETTLTLTTHYTVTGVDVLAGGTVVLVNGAFDWLDAGGDLDTGWALTIQRNVPITQLADIRNQGPYFPEVHEDQFDKQTMIDQQQQNEIDTSVKLPDTIDPDDFDVDLPTDLVGKVNYLLRTNSTGDALEVVSAEDVLAGVTDGGPVVIANSQAVATSITGMTADAAVHSSAEFFAEFTRSTTVMGSVRIGLFRKNGVWVLHEGPSIGDDHGLTFTVTEAVGIAQVKYTSDATGAGFIKFKRTAFDV